MKMKEKDEAQPVRGGGRSGKGMRGRFEVKEE